VSEDLDSDALVDLFLSDPLSDNRRRVEREAVGLDSD